MLAQGLCLIHSWGVEEVGGGLKAYRFSYIFPR